MNPRFSRLFTCVVLPFLILTQNCSAISLKDTVALALNNNNTIKMAQNQVGRSTEEQNAAYRRLWPTLSLDSSYKYVSEIATITMPSIPGTAAKDIDLGVHDTYENGLTISWLIFNGFAKEALVRLSNIKHTAELQALSKTKKDIALKTATIYLNIQSLKLF